MKKLIYIFNILLLIGCTTESADQVKENEIIKANRVVVLEFDTTEPNFDEIRISYFDYKTNTYPIVIHEFEYDSSGEAIPFILKFEKYNFRYINGVGYRNNPSTAELSVKLYVDDVLVLEDADRGRNGEYAEISFDYDAGF
ncbi:MAG: hypothetical protein WAO74_02715 [Polaribacter sp.]|uniref:hypothetical protein n=1 Tax=Polaribacter sp. TaxID=1920175 RepID=UPI003BAEE1EC